MATIPPPDPQPDQGPVETPQPSTPPAEVQPIPGDVDVPDPGVE
ncbi:MAG TPA: hypothetical protein VL405_00265 [Sphingomonas sp.]|nr:hypothetical protein [Sphingomonas sp.]